MESSAWYLAIDFGTAYTTACIASDRAIEPVTFGPDGLTRIPSAVLVTPDRRLAVGLEAEELASQFPDNLESAPKRRVGQTQVHLGGSEWRVSDLVAAVLASVAARAKEQMGGRPPSAVCLTYPARWGEHRRGVLKEAASRAGLGEVQLLSEPEAAAYYFGSLEPMSIGRTIGVYDLGAGTFDAAVLTRTPDGFEFSGTPGGIDPFGGDDVDASLRAHVFSLPESREAAELLASCEPRLAQRVGFLLSRRLRKAKERLSAAESVEVELGLGGQQVNLSRDDLRQVAQADIAATISEFANTCARAGTPVQQMSAIYLSGGSSRLPLVREAFVRQFGDRTDQLLRTLSDPKLVVAQGAGHRLLDHEKRKAAPARRPANARQKFSRRQLWYQAPVAAVAAFALILVMYHSISGGKTNTVQGYVHSSSGRPVADTVIFLGDGTTQRKVKTDKNGHYSTSFPDGQYQLDASANVLYQKSIVNLDLKPESLSEMPVVTPMSKDTDVNWIMPLTGANGASLSIYDYPDNSLSGSPDCHGVTTLDCVPANSLVRFDFKPDGPLVDGSASKAFSRTVSVSDITSEIEGYYFQGIPQGKFLISATLLYEGQEYPLCVSYDSSQNAYGSLAVYPGTRIQTMYVGIYFAT